jgi:hypothetical protein
MTYMRGDSVVPAEAVSRLVEIITARDRFFEDDVYSALAKAGLPDAVADRAYKFTQTAWTRAFLTPMGVRFPPDFLCFNAQGEVIEAGQLDQEPYFVAATQLVPQYAKSPGFAQLVRMSADVGAANDLLHQGSRPENLAMGPAAFFLEPATREGLARARQILTERATQIRIGNQSGSPKAEKADKPWWRFW